MPQYQTVSVSEIPSSRATGEFNGEFTRIGQMELETAESITFDDDDATEHSCDDAQEVAAKFAARARLRYPRKRFTDVVTIRQRGATVYVIRGSGAWPV